MRRSRFALSGVAIALVVATGCSHTVEGTPSNGAAATSPESSGTTPSAKAPEPTKSADGVDYRSADPCSFLTKEAFDHLIENVTGGVNNSDYSSCGLGIAGSANGKPVAWDVELDMSTTMTTPEQINAIYHVDAKTKNVAGTPVFEGESKEAGCLRAFQLPIPATYMIRVKGKSLQCPAADAALTSALDTVKNKKVEHYKLPKNSLGDVDICVEFLTQAKSMLGADATSSPNGVHGCHWTSGKASVLASLIAEPWPPSGFPSDAKQHTVAGRQLIAVVGDESHGTFAQAAVNFGSGTVGKKGSVDVLEIIASETGGDTVKTKFDSFVALIAHNEHH